jgi:hypothetical protein
LNFITLFPQREVLPAALIENWKKYFRIIIVNAKPDSCA